MLTLGLAVTLDLLLSEPPNRYHPVAWMGRYIRAWTLRSPACGNGTRFASGMLLTLSGVAVFSLPWCFFKTVDLPEGVEIALSALGLKAVISLQRLLEAGKEVEQFLRAGDLSSARRSVGGHLVSRPTEDLEAGHVASAAIESLAENLSDSFIAPLLAFAVGGLPAAWAYRFVNTADAMIGYRDPQFEFLGKFVARLDDLLNLLPSRLTAVMLVVAGGVSGGDWRAAWEVMVQQHGRTASPNAGWPMAAAAGALGVTLEKAGAYRLEGGVDLPGWEAIRRARLLVAWAGALGGAACSALIVVAAEVAQRV